MKGFAQVVFFTVPKNKQLGFTDDLHHENLPIQISSTDTEEYGWQLLTNLPTNLKYGSSLVIIVPQNLILIKTIRKEYRSATILVWDEHICSREAKKAGADAAFNYSNKMTLWLLREIVNVAEQFKASV